MNLRALTNGAITVDATVNVKDQIIGGLLITADGTNNAVVKVRRENAEGKPVIDITTKIPLWITGPISLENTSTAYVNVSGTGAAVQVYEWIS